jgi:hypothetical protein
MHVPTTTARWASLILLVTLPCRAADEGPFGGRPADGHGTLTFTDRSDLSTNKEIATRMGWDLAAAESAKVDYTLPDESFEIYVPKTYDGEKPAGLFVYVSPGPSGKPPKNWLKSMDDHGLIWVSPNKVGNDRFVRPRMGLAIDAAHNMPKRYKIDPRRIYVAGVSGGGRVASMLGVGFPDVFTGGGFYMIGCNFYRQERSAEQDGVFRRSYNVPPTKIYQLAKRTKHVFLTGDTDGNREQTQLYYTGFRRDGFDHSTCLQVPGMGHRAPDAEWFEKGIAALEEVIEPKPASPARTTAATRPAPARPATTQSADANAVAKRLLATARLYVDNRQHDLAREKLNWIVQTYPTTPAAAEARRLLKQLPVK